MHSIMPKELLNLMRAGSGHISPTLKLVNGYVIDVFSSNIIKADVMVFKDRVVAIGSEEDYPTSQSTKVVDVSGKYLAPGFMDAHIHIESTLLIPAQLAKILIPHGVTSLFADPHEIGNVLGVKGIKLLLKLTEGIPLRVFIEVPSRVPTAPGLETSGAVLGVEEVGELLDLPESVSLGELNYQNLLSGREEYFQKIAAALSRGKVANGHLAMLKGVELNAALAAGLMDDHESVSAEEAMEKVVRGAAVFVREGTSERNLEDIIKGVLGRVRDFRRFMFCTDDKHPEDIVREGHIDYNVRKAVELGVDPVVAIQMATYNIATHFRVDHLVGAVAPHRKADIVVISNIDKVT
ncbi:MAG: adenine deaminase, partial [Thermoprotei archaeon]